MKTKKIVLVVVYLIVAGMGSVAFAAENGELDYYSIIYREVRGAAPGLGEEEVDWMTRAILYSSFKWGVDPILVTAVFEQESGFRMGAISGVGAIGIAQLMPRTAEGLGVNPYDPLENVDGGVHYLKIQLDTFAKYGVWRATYAVAAYNAGPGAVQRYGGVPPYNETMHYVACVSNIYGQIKLDF